MSPAEGQHADPERHFGGMLRQTAGMEAVLQQSEQYTGPQAEIPDGGEDTDGSGRGVSLAEGPESAESQLAGLQKISWKAADGIACESVVKFVEGLFISQVNAVLSGLGKRLLLPVVERSSIPGEPIFSANHVLVEVRVISECQRIAAVCSGGYEGMELECISEQPW